MRKIAIIGGTGIYSPETLQCFEEKVIQTPYGAALCNIGTMCGNQVIFITRHGVGHKTAPHKVNYRANIWALKSLGTEEIFATTAVGSLNPDMEPGHFVVCDQVLDFTKSRINTFYDNPERGVAHVDFTNPYCPRLRDKVINCLYKTDIIFHKKGTSPNPLKIMFCAHIDEVGFMVRHISDIGFVYLVALGSVLNKSKEMAQSLNNVSEAIQEMATTYRNTEQVNYGEGNNKIGNKQIFLSELLNNLEPYKENMLYEDIADTEGEIVSEIFDFLLDKQEITTQDLLKIFADCNSYVVGLEDKNISKYLEENISQMVRVINVSYKISKSNFIWRKKVEENQKNI